MINFSRFYFPGLHLLVPQLETLHNGINPVNGNVSDAALKCIDEGVRWLEQLTMLGVVNLMRSGSFDHLTVMWTLRAGLPW